MKKYLPAALNILSVILCVTSAVLSYTRVQAKKNYMVACRTIGNYEEAQKDLALYQKDPITYKQFARIDGDGDGKACEDLF